MTSNPCNDPEREKMLAGQLQHNIPVVHIECARELWAEIGRLRAAFETFIGEVNEAEGDYAIGLAMTKAEKALGAAHETFDGPYCPDTHSPCKRMCQTMCHIRTERASAKTKSSL